MGKQSRRDTMDMNAEQKTGNALKYWDSVIKESKSGFIMAWMSYVDVALFWDLRRHGALLERCACTALMKFVARMSEMPGFKRMVEGKRIMPNVGQPGYMYEEDDLVKKS